MKSWFKFIIESLPENKFTCVLVRLQFIVFFQSWFVYVVFRTIFVVTAFKFYHLRGYLVSWKYCMRSIKKANQRLLYCTILFEKALLVYVIFFNFFQFSPNRISWIFFSPQPGSAWEFWIYSTELRTTTAIATARAPTLMHPPSSFRAAYLRLKYFLDFWISLFLDFSHLSKFQKFLKILNFFWIRVFYFLSFWSSIIFSNLFFPRSFHEPVFWYLMPKNIQFAVFSFTLKNM